MNRKGLEYLKKKSGFLPGVNINWNGVTIKKLFDIWIFFPKR